MNFRGSRGFALVSVWLLAACGGGGGGSGPVDGVGDVGGCDIIAGGTTVASLEQSNCPGCMASNTEQAVDADIETAATLNGPSVAAGFAGLRATAQDGVVFAGGASASAIVARTSDAFVIVAGSLVLRTYLDNTLQEEHVFSNDVVGGDVISVGDKYQYAFTTSKAFDAVEFGIAGSAENYQADYYAFCSG